MMATWIAYLRIAENILNEGFKFDKASENIIDKLTYIV